ncbi:hypothetical protein [Oscillatoria salina]|uniref:hypothetical protein n=1 Tax=Oscillatoria salina TaxID=331517 RepID=UPI001CD002C7|nr:hypothetical protein [Oscillatoria salina]MBZ8182219.1 hypothetical protein [Oscillatoria salina IIICB1]
MLQILEIRKKAAAEEKKADAAPTEAEKKPDVEADADLKDKVDATSTAKRRKKVKKKAATSTPAEVPEQAKVDDTEEKVDLDTSAEVEETETTLEVAPAEKAPTPASAEVEETETTLEVAPAEKAPTPASAEVEETETTLEVAPAEKAPTPASAEVEEKTADADASGDAEEKEETKETSHYFQGIGTLYGQASRRDDGEMMISIGEHQFRLSFRPGGKYNFSKQLQNNPSTPLFLRVYPKVLYIPRKPPEMYFVVVAWCEENQWETEPGQFTLCGIWQFIAPSRLPVISIYRNPEAPDPTKKFKATHVPIRMRREGEVQPFRFNPKTPKEDLPKKWFIQGNFRFLPEGNCFEWVEDIEPPTDEIPRYKKPFKVKPKFSNKKKPSDRKNFSNKKKPSKNKPIQKK